MIARLAAAGVNLACPACGGEFVEWAERWDCAACGRAYPVVAGVPDLRLRPDRFLSLEEDRLKARALAGHKGGFAALVEAYWRMEHAAPLAAARAYRLRQLAEPAAGRALWREARRALDPLPPGPLLDAGCGLGGLLAAAGADGLAAVGIDAACRWAVVARRLLDEAVSAAVVLCANAEHPPFRAGTFGVVVANDLLEHVEEPEAVLRAAAAVARPEAGLYAASNHRWSLAPDPHARLVGLGWLPRRAQPAYLRLRGRGDAVLARALGGGELRRLVAAGGWRPGRVEAAPVFGRRLDALSRAGVAFYERLRRLPGARFVAPRVAVAARRIEPEL